MTIICCKNVRISACHEWYWRHISYRRSFDDRSGLDDLLLVQLRAGAVEVAHDGRHARLVAHGRGEMHLLLRVILGEAVCPSMPASPILFLGMFGIIPLDLAPVTRCTLPRQERQRTVARSLELPVRHVAGEGGGWWRRSRTSLRKSSMFEVRGNHFEFGSAKLFSMCGAPRLA